MPYSENEREEIFAEVFDGIPTKEKLESMSEISLAALHASANKPASIIIQNEWRRREKLEQHKLNLELLVEQNKATKLSGMYGIIGAVVGSVLTAILSILLK